MQFRCPDCRQVYEMPDRVPGQKYECSACDLPLYRVVGNSSAANNSAASSTATSRATSTPPALSEELSNWDSISPDEAPLSAKALLAEVANREGGSQKSLAANRDSASQKPALANRDSGSQKPAIANRDSGAQMHTPVSQKLTRATLPDIDRKAMPEPQPPESRPQPAPSPKPIQIPKWLWGPFFVGVTVGVQLGIGLAAALFLLMRG
jgi:hypothetical protein